MAKNVKSWMPKGGKAAGRSASTGQFVTVTSTARSLATTVVETVRSGKSSLSSRYLLRDGTVVTSVRKDVLDRALGRGEFSKKVAS